MESLFVTGVGSYLPKLMHTNQTLPPLDSEVTEAELEKIGVRLRGWAGEDEGIAEMAARAAERALARADVKAADLDFVILANWTQRRYIPEHAPKVKALLGATRAFAFDVSTACAGFVHGVAIAHGFLQNPRFHRGVVVASETTSQRGRPASKSTLVFGDASGAVVVERDRKGAIELIDYELAVDETQHHIMDVNQEGWVRTHVKQKELVELTSRCFRDTTSKILGRNGLTMNDVDYVLPHSGTAGVQAALVRTLEVPQSKVLTNFATIGNVSSAAIPTALDEFLANGTLKPGHLVLSPAVGTGFYSAALLYRIGGVR
ncbi:MAG: 3-oxoacyl-[acyl-carrier-protein] synthase III C-terminal domain-containing protein [Polyangiales bacterium]